MKIKPSPIWSVTARTHVTTWRATACKWEHISYTGGRSSYPLDHWRPT